MKAKQVLLKRFWHGLFLTFTFIFLTSTAAGAVSVTIHWAPNKPAPEGYRVYARKAGGSYDYSQPHCDSPSASCTIGALESQTEYYFVVRAYDGRLTSGNSAETRCSPQEVDNGSMPDDWEIHFDLEGAADDPKGDLDRDGVTHHDELRAGLEPDDSKAAQAAPSSPVISYPEPYEEVESTPLLGVEAFTDADGDAHISTQWQIFDTQSGECQLDVISDSRLDSLQVPCLLLDGNRTYHWRARFFDSGGRASAWSQDSFLTTAPVSNDTDGNGIPDDRQVDDMQAVVAGSLGPSSEADSEPTDLVAASEETISSIEQVLVIDAAEFEIDETTPAEPPATVLGYRLDMKEPGQRSRVTIYLSEPVSRDAQWFRYDEIRGWQDNSEHVSLSEDQQHVTIEVKDGGFGDADGAANGTIVDCAGFVASSSGDGPG